MPASPAATRQEAVSDLKKTLILDAARQVFEADGFEGASMRAIAKQAGYTPGALYFHFPSKEDIYAALLDASLDAIIAKTSAAVRGIDDPTAAMRAAALAFFGFYADKPRDLDLGFYLFRGGMQPHGLGRERDKVLNGKLLAALAPFRQALEGMGLDATRADTETAAFFAHVSGVLLLNQTKRIRLFEVSAPEMVERYLGDLTHRLSTA